MRASHPDVGILSMRSFFLWLVAASPIFAGGLNPTEARSRMKLPENFSATVVASEPLVRQPLSMEFDAKGRLWVLQYLQYPNPAGLKAVKQDQYLRTVWDRVPEPPPKGPKGIDRITILSEPDQDGKYTKSKDFLADLNLATGFCLGNDGVYVVQPPYLLFYPDRNHDDVPDGDPVVLLSGFGMEDTHSYANSLQFAPDGWLYGAHGSTVTAKIKNPAEPSQPAIEFQQGIWRYHVATKRFELFAEGGGNTYGLDFDKYGRCIAGTNYGGFAMLYQMQGAYYVKGFAKHGPLHNPHTYGYFDHVPYDKFKGGHVTCGGVVYQADRYPAEMQDQYVAGNLLSNAIYWHKISSKGSSFTATHGGDLMTTDDIWFRPVDCFQGPDGCVYVADWYDKRAAHLDPLDTWDKTSGRIYRIDYKEKATIPAMDLSRKTSDELCDLLADPNKWYRNQARRLLHERGDKKVLARLQKQALQGTGLLALESLWASNLIEPISDELAIKLLDHTDEHVRSWTIRLLGDRYPRGSFSPSIDEAFLKLAHTDSSVIVRSQLACTAKRLPPVACVKIALALAARPEDIADAQMPLLIWWALEPHVGSPGLMLQNRAIRSDEIVWDSPIMKSVLIERIARRIMAADLEAGVKFTGTGQIMTMIPQAHWSTLFKGLELAMEGRSVAQVPEGLGSILNAFHAKAAGDANWERLRLRFNHGNSLADAHAKLESGKLPENEAIRLVQLLGQLKRPATLPVVRKLFAEGKSDNLRVAAMLATAGYAEPSFGDEVFRTYQSSGGNLRAQSLTFLLAKADTALKVLTLVDTGKVDPKSIAIEQLRPLAEFKNQQIDKAVLKHWGKIGAATPGEKQARISWLGVQLGKAPGNKTHGKELFVKNCATCHQLFGEGAKIGPDLTTADRKNRGYLLAQIVDPSGYVRPEYISFNVTTNDGRRLSGVVQDPNDSTVTLVNVIENKAVKTVISKADIDQMLPSPVSLMPEKILDTLSDDDIRDLFAYLQSEAPTEQPKPKAAGGDSRNKLKVLLVSGSLEYKSDESLSNWQKHLESLGNIEVLRAFRKADDDIPGLIDGLKKCDVAVFFTRRLKIDGPQLEAVKKYSASGKPIIGIRTASHGFQNWLAMDKQVYGGDYGNHYGHELMPEIITTEVGKKHPILSGVTLKKATGGLYKNANVNKDVTVLMTGKIPDHTEPIAWTREVNKGRVFYTSLGHPKDFEDENFIRLLDNAVWWVSKVK